VDATRNLRSAFRVMSGVNDLNGRRRFRPIGRRSSGGRVQRDGVRRL